MSLFDSMMYPNGKNQKQTNKYTAKSAKSDNSQSKKSMFNEEFGHDFLSRKASEDSDDLNSELKGESKKAAFKEEFSEGLMNDAHFGVQSYSKAGVTFEKLSETQARVNYTGLLAKSGAHEVFGVYGFGSNQNWENVSTISLNKANDGTFISVIPVEQGKNINLAFKDCAENWDNNSGMNYTFVN